MYGLCQGNKDIVDNCPPFLPFWPFLVSSFKSFTSNEYVVKKAFAFAEEIVEQDSEYFMGILDVDSLFTNIPD